MSDALRVLAASLDDAMGAGTVPEEADERLLVALRERGFDVVPTPKPSVTPKDLLTESEREVLGHLSNARSRFTALPKGHSDDVREFRDGIHRLQDMILSRYARRHLWRGRKP